MKPKRILVVDDEEMIVKLCCRVLTKEGYEVKDAPNGKEAMRLASIEEFNMIVTDMLMPGIDGLETFLALREKQHDLIGVMITGHGTIDMAIQAMDRGFSGFVRKPFPPLELIQVVRDSFRKSALVEENTRLKTLLPLYSLGEKFITAQTRKEVLDGLIETVSQQTDAQRISAMLYDEKEDCLKIAAAKGMGEEVVETVRIKPGENIAGQVFQKGDPLIINGGPEENPKFASFLKSKNIVAAILFPLKSRDRTLGVLNISKVGKGSPFSSADIEMLSVICGQAVMALENVRVMDEREEKVRMRTLFEQYVAPEVAGMLISHGQNPMEIGDIKKITVLFADIRNFTPLVQHLSLETLRSFLNDFFGLMTEEIFRFKGTLDKFMGDALLASFGAPIPVSDPGHAAVNSAILMNDVFDKLKDEWTAKYQALNEIGLGIGISSGELFLGNVGSQKRFDYTVIGTDVNVAQRLASEAPSGQILITKSVKDELGSKYNVTQESSRLLKGLAEPISVFSVAR
jgi:adenylate cyclase